MTYTAPKFTTGPATQRSDVKVRELLAFLRDSEQRDWMPGELGNKFGFRNLGTAEWHGYVERRISPQGRETDFVDLTEKGKSYLSERAA